MAYLGDAQRRSATEPGTLSLKRTRSEIGFYLERWGSLVIVVSILTIWEWQVRAGNISALFFPAPTTIARTLAHWLTDGALTPHLTATLSRILMGLILGGITGLVLGLGMGWSRRLRVILDPLIAATHPMPKIAILPLIMLLFGIGETSKFVVIAIGVFFQMLINTMAGVRQIAPLYFEVAENYGASSLKVFRRVIIPGSLPQILTGMRLALNTSLVLTIAVELTTAQKGLGALIWLAWETFRTEELYASLFVTAVLGISFNVILLRFLTKYLIPWHINRSQR